MSTACNIPEEMGGMVQLEVAALQGNPMHQHASETEHANKWSERVNVMS